MLWNERCSRLKLALPCRGALTYDVPGSVIKRDVAGQVPGARWVTRAEGKRVVGLAGDVLSDFDASPGELSVTLARASRYANDVTTAPDERLWEPAVDCGELKFQLRLFGGNVAPDTVAEELLCPPVVATAPATPGEWKRKGSLAEIQPSSLRLLSLNQTERGRLRVRVQNREARAVTARIRIGASRKTLGAIQPDAIRTFEV